MVKIVKRKKKIIIIKRKKIDNIITKFNKLNLINKNTSKKDISNLENNFIKLKIEDIKYDIFIPVFLKNNKIYNNNINSINTHFTNILFNKNKTLFAYKLIEENNIYEEIYKLFNFKKEIIKEIYKFNYKKYRINIIYLNKTTLLYNSSLSNMTDKLEWNLFIDFYNILLSNQNEVLDNNIYNYIINNSTNIKNLHLNYKINIITNDLEKDNIFLSKIYNQLINKIN